ncbi:MAG: hypothetical protein EB101_07315, partial [Chitinophagia bacterium]|nr:hypothetical protein [Chitinophagia bacterium]
NSPRARMMIMRSFAEPRVMGQQAKLKRRLRRRKKFRDFDLGVGTYHLRKNRGSVRDPFHKTLVVHKINFL